jgi:hypothetical protein
MSYGHMTDSSSASVGVEIQALFCFIADSPHVALISLGNLLPVDRVCLEAPPGPRTSFQLTYDTFRFSLYSSSDPTMQGRRTAESPFKICVTARASFWQSKHQDSFAVKANSRSGTQAKGKFPSSWQVTEAKKNAAVLFILSHKVFRVSEGAFTWTITNWDRASTRSSVSSIIQAMMRATASRIVQSAQ